MITRVDYIVPDLSFKINEDKSNAGDFYCADVIGGKSFVLNDAGFPLNDVDLIIKQQDLKVAESLMKQLQEIPTTGVPFDTPNEVVLKSLKSRYQQTPSEMVKFYEKQLEIAKADALAKASEKSNDDTISFNEVEDNVES